MVNNDECHIGSLKKEDEIDSEKLNKMLNVLNTDDKVQDKLGIVGDQVLGDQVKGDQNTGNQITGDQIITNKELSGSDNKLITNESSKLIPSNDINLGILL